MIRNVAIHISNEQPLMADLYSLPTASDAGLVCTNLRSMDGKRPTFVDNSASVFFFPYLVIRFLEVPPESMARHMAEGGGAMPASAPAGAWIPMASRSDGADGDGDDAAGPAGRLPVPYPDGEPEIGPDEPDVELEIDEDFLQRIRDI